MKDTKRIAKELFDKIQSRFEEITLGGENAESVDDPESARFFNFDYIDRDGENFGNITISLIDSERLKLYFGRRFGSEMTDRQRHRWYEFLKHMRKFAKQNLMQFDPRDISRSKLRQKDIKTIAKLDSPQKVKDTNLNEHLLPMGSRLSYQNLGPIRLVVKHLKPLDSEYMGSRSRSIDSIFLQNGQGERFRSPYRSLSVARALANHLTHGGQVNDAAYSSICQYVDDLKKLGGFLRRANKEQYQDSEILGLVQEARNEYDRGRTLVKRLGQSRTYDSGIKELMERYSDDASVQDQDYLREKFSKQVIDQRIESALPTISKLYHQRQKNKKVIMEKYSWMLDKKLINKVAEDLAIYESAMSYESVESLVEHVLETLKTHLSSHSLNEQLDQISEYQARFSDIKNTLEGRVISKFVTEVLKQSRVAPKREIVTDTKRDMITELIDDEFGQEDLPDFDIKKLQQIFDKKLEFGFDGDNAIGTISELLPSEKLKDLIYQSSQDQETEDARPLIKYFLMDKYPEIADEIDFEKPFTDTDEKEEAASAPAPAPAPAPMPEQPMVSIDDTEQLPAEEPVQPAATPTADQTEVDDLKKLAGL
jgi:hypothetical protein